MPFSPIVVARHRAFVLPLLMLISDASILSLARAADLPDAVCEIRFSGSSSLHDFSGSVPSLHASLRPSAVQGHWDVDVVVPVSGMRTDNDARDARMREMLHSERGPEIRATLLDIDPERTRQSSRLSGSLTIASVTRPIEAAVRNWQEQGPRVSFDAQVDLSLEDFSLEAPTVLGLIRVADQVRVDAHVVVDRAGAAAAGQGGVHDG